MPDELRKLIPIALSKEIEPAEDLGSKPRLKWLPLDRLYVDTDYQRSLSARGMVVIKRIVEGFRWEKFQPISVSPRGDDRYCVTDGQHRAIAAMNHPAVTEVPCWVARELSQRDQARVFTAINKDRTNPTLAQLYYADLAGGDPDALHTQAVLDEAGWTIERYPVPGGCRPRHTKSITTLRKLLAQFGDKPVVQALKILGDAYPEERDQGRAHVIAAMTRVFADFDGEPRFRRDRLLSVLQDMDMSDQLVAAQAYARNFKVKIEIGLRQAILKRYDTGLRAGNKLGEL